MAYIGWVPTANGRLSFRHLGDTRSRGFRRYANTVDAEHKRVVVGVERRALSDLLFRRITELLTGRSGSFWFLLQAFSSQSKVGDIDALEGIVSIYQPQSFKSLFKGSAFFAGLKAMQRHHIGLARLDNLSAYSRAFVEESMPPADIKLEFTLYRDGEIKVCNPNFADQGLVTRSKQLAKERGVDFEEWIANQAYFFIRDFCHVHQHHSPDIDTIIILQSSGGDDLRWRRRILYSMHHYIIRMR